MTAFRLAHLSDIHFGGENREALAAATDWMAGEALDLVVVSGDLTRYGEVAEFRAAAAWLESLPHPRFVTPGNHDAPYLAWAVGAMRCNTLGRRARCLPEYPTAPRIWRPCWIKWLGVGCKRAT